jgi:DNA-binding HxlR family transcriptional regulator
MTMPQYEKAADAVHLIGGRWKVRILAHLLSEPGGLPMRFSVLHRALGTDRIRKGVLAVQLRELERDGLIARTVSADAPRTVSADAPRTVSAGAPVLVVRVDYALTPRGRLLEPALAALAQWASSAE